MDGWFKFNTNMKVSLTIWFSNLLNSMFSFLRARTTFPPLYSHLTNRYFAHKDSEKYMLIEWLKKGFLRKTHQLLRQHFVLNCM